MNHYGNLYRNGGLNISKETRPSTYEILDPNIHSVEFTSDNVNFFLAIDVRLVEPKPDDNLTRKVTDANGNVRNVETAPYCPAFPALIRGQFEDLLERHCPAILKEMGDVFLQLLELVSSDERLTTVKHFLCLAAWKTGSGYLKPGSALNIEALPSDSQTLASREPVPRLIIHFTDLEADKLCEDYQKEVLAFYEKLISDPTAENVHLAYMILRAFTYFGNVYFLSDDARRKSQGAPGTETSVRDRLYMLQQKEMLHYFVEGMKQRSITYEAVIDVSDDIRRFHETNTAVTKGCRLPKLEKLCYKAAE